MGEKWEIGRGLYRKEEEREERKKGGEFKENPKEDGQKLLCNVNSTFFSLFILLSKNS